MHGCSACKHAGTSIDGNNIMPALSTAQNEARLAAGAWAWCVAYDKSVSTDDGRNCPKYYPDREDYLRY